MTGKKGKAKPKLAVDWGNISSMLTVRLTGLKDTEELR
jgi:hypothetical protein